MTEPTQQQLELGRQWLDDAKQIAVLSGAGMSAESGVPTFRGAGGLWKGLNAMELASPDGFARDPELVWEWYNWRRQTIAETKPNPGHEALAKAESLGRAINIATQNVDRLHQRAGSKNVIELHGSIWDTRCLKCNQTEDQFGVQLSNTPQCNCGGKLRPGVVWFGEMLPAGAIENSAAWAEAADVFLVLGTSAVVYPAAGLIDVARRAGCKTIEINIDETPATASVDLAIRRPTGEALPFLLRTCDD